jgi:Domain of unknown function (DUF3597)
MGLFSTILSKLGFGDDKAKAAEAAAAAPAAPVEDPNAPVVTMDSAPVAMDMVDVVAQLEGMAAASKEKLNWKVSIVDLLKLLGMDDSAQMNMWLHKTVLQRIAANGGNVPADLLD